MSMTTDETTSDGGSVVPSPAAPAQRRAPGPERAYTRPHRPLPVRAANRAARLLGSKHRALGLDPVELMNTVAAQMRLDDFGSDEFVEPLNVLSASLDHEAALTPLGRYFARGQLLTALRNRLLLREATRQDPGLVEEPLAPVTIIVGLPRTGSTLLQHLLACDPQHRALIAWEAARPVPMPGQADKRQREVARGIRFLDYLAPNARALHPVSATLPTECVTLMANSFGSLELATINYVPSYLDWCLQSSLARHYDYLYQQLQVLEHRQRAPRWLLKSPAHLLCVDQILDRFPGAKVIQTHRDPAAVLGSFCSLSAMLCSIGSDAVPIDKIGQRWSAAWNDALDRADAVRDSRPDATIVDVWYDQLVVDPIGVVRELYTQLELELSTAAVEQMTAYLARPAHNARGVHRYTLEQFGLDPDSEAARSARYRARYGL